MTNINRRLQRESISRHYSKGKLREIIILIEPPGTRVGFRLKGERKTVYLDLKVAYTYAATLTMKADKERKKQERAAKRK